MRRSLTFFLLPMFLALASPARGDSAPPLYRQVAGGEED